MIRISIDASKPHAAVDAMLKKLNHFKRVDIGNELSAWQMQDMHRGRGKGHQGPQWHGGRPFTMRSRAKGRATTVIRPHSDYEVNRREKPVSRYERAIRRLLRRRRIRKIPKTPIRTSTRSYLRPELLHMLEARMARLLREKLTWQ
jgi:hypothetical protein